MADIGQRPKKKIITESKFLNSFDREGYERAECPRCHGTGTKDHKDCWQCARRGVVYILTEEKPAPIENSPVPKTWRNP